MEIRLLGTAAETRHAITLLRTVLTVRTQSPYLPNRGAPQLGRIYLDADLPHQPSSTDNGSQVRR